VFYTWGVRRDLPMAELRNYTALKDRLMQRAAVQRVLEEEKVKL
jgi:glutathione S-transferase